MSKLVKTSIALWFVFALVVFNVTFDWESRFAGHAFVASQLARQAHGQPTLTINDGFRPMIRAAAADSALWLVLIALGGAAASVLAGRHTAPAGRAVALTDTRRDQCSNP